MPDRPTERGRGSERRTPSPVPLIIAGACLAIAIIAPLLVGTYDRIDPELAGVPFFFWYQFLLVIIAVALTSIAYRFVLRYEKDRKATQADDGETP